MLEDPSGSSCFMRAINSESVRVAERAWMRRGLNQMESSERALTEALRQDKCDGLGTFLRKAFRLGGGPEPLPFCLLRKKDGGTFSRRKTCQTKTERPKQWTNKKTERRIAPFLIFYKLNLRISKKADSSYFKLTSSRSNLQLLYLPSQLLPSPLPQQNLQQSR